MPLRSILAASAPMAAVWLRAASALAAFWGAAEAAHAFNAQQEALAGGADVARNTPATRLIRSVDIRLPQHESESADDGALEKASAPGVHFDKGPSRRDGGAIAPAQGDGGAIAPAQAAGPGPNAPAVSTSTSAHVQPQSDDDLLEAFRTTCARFQDEITGNMPCKIASRTLSEVDLLEFKKPVGQQSQKDVQIKRALDNFGQLCPAEYVFEALPLLLLVHKIGLQGKYLPGLVRNIMHEAARGTEGGIMKLGQRLAGTMLVWCGPGRLASFEVLWAACQSGSAPELLDPWVQRLFGNDVKMGVVAAQRLGQIYMAAHRYDRPATPVACRQQVMMFSLEQLQKAWDSKDLAGAVREVACQQAARSRAAASGGFVAEADWQKCQDLDPAHFDPEPFEDFSEEEIDDLLRESVEARSEEGEESSAPKEGEESSAPKEGEASSAPKEGEESSAPKEGEESSAPTPSTS